MEPRYGTQVALAARYTYHMQVYCGKQGPVGEQGQSYRFVKDLYVPHLGPFNHVVYMDNFFTSLPLLQHLEANGIYTVGTIRSNRKDYPNVLKDKQMLKQMAKNRGEYHTSSNGSTTVMLWQDTKTLSFISNVHQARGNGEIRRKKREGTVIGIACPPSVKDYNKNRSH